MQRENLMMRGWEFYVWWKGDSGDSVAIKYLKDSDPVPLADYVMENNIQDDPAFPWWVTFALRKLISII